MDLKFLNLYFITLSTVTFASIQEEKKHQTVALQLFKQEFRSVSSPLGSDQQPNWVELKSKQEDVVHLAKLEKTFWHPYRYFYPVELSLKRAGIQLFFEGQLIEVNEANIHNISLQMPLKQYKNCSPITAVDEDLDIRQYEVCVTLGDDALQYTSELAGPFQYRKMWGYWMQGGLSLVQQTYPDRFSADSSISSYASAIRGGAGLWHNNIGGELYYRQNIYELAPKRGVQSQWIEGRGSYTFEFGPKWMSPVKLFLIPFVGYEMFFNSIEGVSKKTPYLSQRFAYYPGFRSRFVITPRFETGGEFFYRILDLQSYFVQGDVTYWLDEHMALGFGYWMDATKYEISKVKYSERHFSLETFLRFHY